MKSVLVACALTLASVAHSANAQPVEVVQSALEQLGYDPGPVDGLWGGKTRDALAAYLKARGRSFDGKLSHDAIYHLHRGMRELVEADEKGRVPENYNGYSFFDHELLTLPAEYAFSNGASKPANRNHAYTVPFPHVHDFNGDGCTDVMSQFMDSRAHPRIIYGNPEGEFNAVLAEDFPATNSIRNTASRDLNGDGLDDFVAFTGAHDLEGTWFVPGTDRDVVAIAGGAANALPNGTFAHGGFAGDVNGDGIPDVFPIQESPDNARYAYLGDGKGGFTERFRVRAFDGKVVFSARSGDFNGDGIDDFAILTSRKYGSRVKVTPADIVDSAFVVALGELGKSIDELNWVSHGSHPMTKAEWTLYRLSGVQEAGYDRNTGSTYASASNIDLLDFDQDGDLDILVGYFVSADSDWHTSKFQIFENVDGAFTDVTARVVPFQPANRTGAWPEGALIGANLIDANDDGALDLLLSLNAEDARKPVKFSSSLYLNHDGVFTPVTAKANGIFTLRYLQTGDFNCDGRTDYVGVGRKMPEEQQYVIMLAKPADQG